MGIIKEKFGTEKGKDVYLYTMSNSKGMTVKAMNLGCHIMEINAPDRDGNIEDVVLSFDDLEAAKKQTAFFGVVAGRCANRIKGATFELNGRTYKLFANNGENHLHGGKEGFDKKVWDSEILEDGDGVRFYYLSPDGEEGYPGNLKAQVTYSLTEDNELKIEYEAVSDADTIINLTNHSYFNLAGHDSGTILDHYLKMNCDEYTECDSDRIPTGVIAKVEGTPFDFREYHRIGERIDAPNEQLKNGRGYDHNFVINNEDGKVVHAASLWDKKSGRIMEVYTDKPGVQLYTGNSLDGKTAGKGGYAYDRQDGICLETQFFPNSINVDNFPSPVLKAGETYRYTTVYRFTVDS